MGILLQNAALLDGAELRDILVEDGRIAAAAPGLPVREGTQTFACGGRLVLPGLVNVHTHLDKSGLAGRVSAGGGTIGEARRALLAYKREMTREDIKARARQTALDSVRCGVTALRTHVDVDPVVGLRGIEALLELREELKGLLTLQVVAFPQEGITEAPGTYELMREALRMGADIVGGHLSIAADCAEHAARVFDLAEEFGREVDVHVDYDIQRCYAAASVHADGAAYPDALGVVALCEEKLRRGFPLPVTADHLCGLDCVAPELARNVIALLRRAQVGVVALPPNNLYCNGREDPCNTRRGVTRLKDLLAGGVNALFAPDNIRDPFNPLGTPDMIQNAILTAYACHMAGERDYRLLLELCTGRAAALMGLEDYGLSPGCRANIAVLDARTPVQALAEHAGVAALFRDGVQILSAGREIRERFGPCSRAGD